MIFLRLLLVTLMAIGIFIPVMGTSAQMDDEYFSQYSFDKWKSQNSDRPKGVDEFNDYLLTSIYYPSMDWYLSKLKFDEFIKIDNFYIKTGILLFIKNYESPIYDENNNVINSINKYDVKTLKYDINKKNNNIDGIFINKNKLRFNLILLDDTSINQMVYHAENNKSTINIKLIKSNHIENLINALKNNSYSDYLMVENL